MCTVHIVTIKLLGKGHNSCDLGGDSESEGGQTFSNFNQGVNFFLSDASLNINCRRLKDAY